ncbi:MAG: hypothetical protein IPL61_15815 [Myxococcales bacterium]|nr:hypothetical protein [Myxococcales bacterium]
MSLTVQVIAAAVRAGDRARARLRRPPARGPGTRGATSIASVVLGAGSVVAGLALVLQGAGWSTSGLIATRAGLARRQPFVRWARILALVDLAFYQ